MKCFECKNNKLKHFVWLGLVCIIFAGFLGALIHHHDDGDERHDCSVCNMAKQIATAFGLCIILLVGFISRGFHAFFPSEERLAPLYLVSNLQSRAPPALA